MVLDIVLNVIKSVTQVQAIDLDLLEHALSAKTYQQLDCVELACS
jgi:hypothetical protein